MPNKKSAMKELRKGQARAKRNEQVMSGIKKLRKQSLKAVLAKDTQAKELVVKTMKALDKAAGKGIIKKNTASRTKSRLHKKLNSATK